MAITNKQLTARAAKKRKMIDELPPTKFPTIINPHVFDHSPVIGDKKCLTCGQLAKHRLHIWPHYFNLNSMSKLSKCMCGLAKDHIIHLKEAK